MPVPPEKDLHQVLMFYGVNSNSTETAGPGLGPSLCSDHPGRVLAAWRKLLRRIARSGAEEEWCIMALNPPIPFNKPFIAGKELYYIAQAVTFGNISGDGHFTQQCRGSSRSGSGSRGPDDALVHRGPGDGGDALRPRAGRRGDPAVVHLRLDGQRGRPARRQARSSSTSGPTP